MRDRIQIVFMQILRAVFDDIDHAAKRCYLPAVTCFQECGDVGFRPAAQSGSGVSCKIRRKPIVHHGPA